MIREKDYVLRNISITVDFILVIGAFFLAHFLRNWLLAPYILPQFFLPGRFGYYYWLLFIMPFLALVFLSLNGYYDSQRILKTYHLLRTIILSCLEVMVASIVIIYLVKRAELVSRGQVVLTPILLAGLLALKTHVMRRILLLMRQQGKNVKNILLVGSGPNLKEFIRLVEGHPIWGFKIQGIMSDSDDVPVGSKIKDHNVQGHIEQTLNYVEKNSVDEVIFIPGNWRLKEIVPVLQGCEVMGVRTHISLNFFAHTIAQPVMAEFENIPVITYTTTKETDFTVFVKYTLDRILALFLILLLSPIFLLTALAIKLTSKKGEPILFKQLRCGLNGRPFVLYKFRSMYVGAEQELPKLRENSDADGPVFKMKKDPRITPIGRIIRRLSIDELPQLFNVLKGEMSLVGPRPPVPEEVAQYDRWQRRRLSMKPGITCLWQVMGRSKLSFSTWMQLDLDYIDNWSLWLDVKILFRTIFVVITGYGAM